MLQYVCMYVFSYMSTKLSVLSIMDLKLNCTVAYAEAYAAS